MLYAGCITDPFNRKKFMKKFSSFVVVAICVMVNSGLSFGQMAASSCTPAFRDSTLACSDGMYVRIINIAGAPVNLNDGNSCNGSGYEDFTTIKGDSCSLSAGTTYTATIETGYTEMSCQVWIDFNNDGIFQPSESVGGISDFGWPGPTAPAALTIPSTAALGTYRMRIVGNWHAGAGGIFYVPSTSTVSIPPCPTTAIYYGDARDYTVNIVTPLSTAVLASVGGVSIYPNPATDELTVKTGNGSYTSLTITNSIGQEMQQQPLMDTETKIDVSKLPVGVYYVTFMGGNSTKVERFVKM